MFFRALCDRLLDGYNSWGYGPWYTWEEAFRVSKEQCMPIMVIIEEDTCIGCSKLREEMTNCSMIRSMLTRFVKVKYKNACAPKIFQPDGEYVPRILFAKWDGELMPIVNKLSKSNTRKYHYSDSRTLGLSMTNALRMFNKP